MSGSEPSNDSSSHVPTVSDPFERAALHARRVHLDERITALELDLQALRDEQHILARQLSYPVHTLPNEIVSEIFVNFLPAYPQPPPPTGILSPVTLTHICRQWREIALSTPTLWRAIDLYISVFQDLDEPLALLAMWLSRSGTCPLSISLQFPTPDYFAHRGSEAKDHDMTPFVFAILPYCTQWDVMNLVLPIECLRLIAGSMPRLRYLRVAPTWSPVETSPGVAADGTFSAFQFAPRLETAALANGFTPCSMDLPWSQLTTITAELIFEYEAYTILRHARALVYFEARLTRPPHDVSVALPLLQAVPPVLHLESLILHGTRYRDGDHKRMLQTLTLPSLRTLHILESSLGSSPPPCDILRSFIARSRCTLHSLRVGEAQISEAVYRQALPSVAEISVYPSEGGTWNE